MLRTFHQHTIRPVDSLAGRWELVLEPERSDRGPLPRAYNRTMHVPAAWEQLPGLETYRGRAWLRTRIPALEGGAVRLLFGGVSHTATVYIDGKRIAHHYDAFTPFDAVAAGLGQGEHELVVEVDNCFGEHSALHLENDYYTYGGITRPVELQLVPEVYIERLFATPSRRGGRWALDVTVRVRNVGRRKQTRRVTALVGDEERDLGELAVAGGKTAEVHGRLTGLDVEPWTPEAPCLYEIDALLADGGEYVDDLTDRVGFREVKVRGKRIRLNGEPIRLRGCNRHEDHALFGNAIPLEAMVQDLEILRDLGCNFVRTCHYPNDMRFLDLCDELGFCVWEESHARNVSFDHPKFREQIADSTREMVEWHRNHPSILMWGCLNECDSESKAGRAEHERVLTMLRELDATRPVTFASNKQERDLCLDLVDIVSWNLYPGWYGGGPEDAEPTLKRLLKWLRTDASGGKGKPVILSEFGAGAIRGCRHPHQAKWTEEYQQRVLDETLRVFLNDKAVSGVAVWQFCDCRVTNGRAIRRPRTMNNKGIVDEYRRPKLAYETVKHRMHEAAESDPT